MTILFLLNFLDILPFVPGFLIAMILLTPPFFKEGKNEHWFLEKNAFGKYFLIIISNINSVYVGKGNITEKGRYRIKKIDIETGMLVYTKKLINTWTYAQVVGVLDKYLYLNVGGKDLLIINLDSGEKIANKRKLLLENPEIIDFSMKDLKINPNSGRLICYTIEGKSVEINPKDLKILAPDEKKLNISKGIFDVHKDLPLFDKQYTWGRMEIEVDDFDYQIEWEAEEGNKRYRLKVAPKEISTFSKKKGKPKIFEYSEKSVSFIKPYLLSKYRNVVFLKKGMHFLVSHQAFLEEMNNLEHQYISLVTACSEPLWQQRYTNIVHKALWKKTDFKMYVKMEEDFIWLFFYNNREVSGSIAVLHTDSGMLATDPILIKNSWWEQFAKPDKTKN